MSQGSSRAGRNEALFVAYCAGHRCAALRRGHADRPSDDTAEPSSAPPSLNQLRAAIRCRPDSVLISTGCLGRCERASVVIVGWGHTAGKIITWSQPPIVVDLVDRTDRAAALASWVATTAPRSDTMPAPADFGSA